MDNKRVVEVLGPDMKTKFSQCLIQFCQQYLIFSDFVHMTGRVSFNIDGRKTSYTIISEMASPNVLQSSPSTAVHVPLPGLIKESPSSPGSVTLEDEDTCTDQHGSLKPAVVQSKSEQNVFLDENLEDAPDIESEEGDDSCMKDDSDDSYHPSDDSMEKTRAGRIKKSRRKRKTSRDQSGDQIVNEHDTKDTRVLKCSFCEFVSYGNRELQDHLKIHDDKRTKTCPDCGKSFFTNDSLSKHKKSVHQKNLTCPRCAEPFQSIVQLKKHGRDIHGLKGKIIISSCPECKRKFYDKKSLEQHSAEEHNYICSVCGDNFAQKILLNQHKEQRHPESYLTCTKCNHRSSSKGALRKHMTRHREKEHGNFTCDICNKRFTAQSTLYHHKRGVHSGIKPYKCTQCDKTFNFHHSLKLHLLQHNGQRPHKCSICNKAYLTSSHLKSHIEAVHTSRKKHACPICDKAFPYENSLKMHMMLHTGEKPFMCCICSKSFVSRSALKVHESSHVESKEFECDICKKMYKTEVLLRAHRRRHTSDGSRYMCDVCGNTFMYKSNLEAHYKVHGETRSFKCEVCDKAFKTYATLYSHQLVHRKDNPFNCMSCGKAFKTKERLKAHEKRHLGLKPFCCEHCGSCFPDKGGLSKHRKTVHATKTRFACPICQKGCNRADNLRVHMKVHGDPNLLKIPLGDLEVKSVGSGQITGVIDAKHRKQSTSRTARTDDNEQKPKSPLYDNQMTIPPRHISEYKSTQSTVSQVIYRPIESGGTGTCAPGVTQALVQQQNAQVVTGIPVNTAHLVHTEGQDLSQIPNNLLYMQYQSFVGVTDQRPDLREGVHTDSSQMQAFQPGPDGYQ